MSPESTLAALVARLSQGAAPFPWQGRLLARMLAGAFDPLDIPTGLGKTSVLSIWLVARAFNPALPGRLVYVVDRRAVVDQASEEAGRIADLLAPGAPAPLDDLRDRLGLGHRRRLPVSTLRGQHADKGEWLADPGLPAVIVGTVDMVGSRLLFEGYGVSRRMRPCHAGLLGHDSLFVLDEAHLVPPFEALVRQIASGDPALGAHGASLPRPPLRAMSLSATGRSSGGTAFRLGEEDYGHPVVAQRLGASKALHLHAAPVRRVALAAELARLAWARAGEGSVACRVVIYCDSRAVASATRVEIGRLAGSAPCELLVGERRVHERQRVAEWLARHGFMAGRPAAAAPAGPAFLIATAAGEVGVDLDAGHMVADLVAWERMVQRLGRVNRRGAGAAVVDVVRVAPEKDGAPEARDLRAQASAQLLGHLPALPGGGVDASPGALDTLKTRAEREQAEGRPALSELLRQATTPPPLRPALTRALLEAWSLTALPDHAGRPEIGPWLRGWQEEEPQTRLIWRRHLPWREGEAAPRRAEVDAFFAHAGPDPAEILEAPAWAALEVLRKRADRILDRAPDRTGRPAAILLSPAAECEASLTLGQLVRLNGKDAVPRATDRVLVLAAELGGLSADGLLDADAGHAPATLDGEEGFAPDRLRILRHPVGAEPALPDGPRWARAHVWTVSRNDEGEAVEEVVVHVAEAARAEPALARTPQTLAAHAEAVERRARDIAARLGLAAPFTEMLAAAARLHDAGKARDAWQAAFGAPADGGPYAKTAARWVDQARLDGYRHEFGSLAEAEADAGLRALPEELRQLALHLIAAHHGFARPLIRAIDPDWPPSALPARACEVALRFAALQRRWGPWGLAWWEALLRAADIQASRAHDGEEA